MYSYIPINVLLYIYIYIYALLLVLLLIFLVRSPLEDSRLGDGAADVAGCEFQR